MIDILYRILYYIFRTVLRILPTKARIALIDFLGKLAYRLSQKHRRIINKNLDLAYGQYLTQEEKDTIGIEAFKNLVDTIFGIMLRDGTTASKLLSNVTFKNEEVILSYLQEGKQFILVTGHYGNWELLSQVVATKYNFDLVGVGRKLDSDAMDNILKQNREQFRVSMVYKKGALKGCIDAIRQKKIVGILTDQHIRNNQSVDVIFFGHKATHTPLASILSRKFGLDMIPAYIHTDDYQHYVVRFYEPILSRKTVHQEEDLSILTQQQADRMEHVIKKDPKQWFWMHNRWKGFSENAENKR